MKPCLLIPIYDHPDRIEAVVAALEYLELPCWIVDDGSGEPTAKALERIEAAFPWVHVERFERNRGRGAALQHGYRLAAEGGYTHALQLDADGQHPPEDAVLLLEAAQASPEALVLASPRFGDDAPLARRYGRWVSRFWTWLECCSLEIDDPLCGLRCTPLAPTLAILDRGPAADGMDFDLEIAVRLVWEGVAVVNVPFLVRYFEGGPSHFRMWDDNVLISRMHARLFFGMLPRAPRLLGRRLGTGV